MSEKHSVTVLEASIGVDDPKILENDGAYYREVIGRLSQIRKYIIQLIKETGRFEDLMKISVALEEAEINAAFHGNLERSSAVKESDNRTAMIKDLEDQCNREMHKRRIEFSACFHTSTAIDQPELEPHTIKTTVEKDDAPQSEITIDQFEIQVIDTEIDASSITAFSISIKDGGKGFNPEEVADPRLPENILRPHGRGLLLMRTFIDEVDFSEDGTRVTFVKNITSS